MAGEHNICFYADYGQISGRDTIYVQAALTTMVRMFESVDLQKYLNKTEDYDIHTEVCLGKTGL